MRDTRRITEPEAQQLLAEWQAALRLADWTLCVTLSPDINSRNRRGEVTVEETKQCASIRLLPGDHPNNHNQLEPCDMEVTLVHEIVHIALAPFIDCRKGTHKHIVQEQAVNSLSKALVAMKRETRARPNRKK